MNGRLDLRADEALRGLRQENDVEETRVDADLLEMDVEDGLALVLVRQVEEEHLVEAALADDLGGQEVDAVRRRRHEDEPLLLLHPREERREDAAERRVAAARLAPAMIAISISSIHRSAGDSDSTVWSARWNVCSGLSVPETRFMSRRKSGRFQSAEMA